MEEKQVSVDFVKRCIQDLKFYMNNAFPDCFTGREKFIAGPHINEWADMFQHNQHTCILAPRKHSKSYTLYGWLMHENLINMNLDLEILYISYKKSSAGYHINRYKRMMEANRMFADVKEISHATSKAVWQWPNGCRHVIEPEGILSFKRGRHPDIVILDDVLADPTTMLDLTVIQKINQRVREEVLSLPKEGGKVKVIGTTQTPVDFFYDLKKNPDFAWKEFKAIINDKRRKVLWPAMFPYTRLMHIKNFEIGDKAFQKEYMLMPVWSADSYFTKSDIMRCVNDKLRHFKIGQELKTKNDVGCGWDIGKHSHPSHISVFEFMPIGEGKNLAIQRYQIFLDGWAYKKQLEFMNHLVDTLRIDFVNYDNTRGEMEGFYEKNEMDKSKFFPITFTAKKKASMAAEFEKRVMYKTASGIPSPNIQLLNDQRMINMILTVTNDLDAIETNEGHGDSFWSIALALDKNRQESFTPLRDPNNYSGLF